MPTDAYKTAVAPGEECPPVRLLYRSGGETSVLRASLVMHTNASRLLIPVRIFDGKLRLSLAPVPARDAINAALPENAPSPENLEPFAEPIVDDPATAVFSLDMGYVPVSEARSRSFRVYNPNPVPVALTSVTTALANAKIRLEGVWNAEGSRVPGYGDADASIGGRARAAAAPKWGP